MVKTNKRRMLRTILALTCAVIITSSELLVYAEPSSAELEQKTSDLQGEVNALSSELDALVSELETTSAAVNTLAAEVEQTKLDLAAAKMNEELQYEAMKDRIKFMYEGGNTNLLHILLSSSDMADFLSNAEYVSTISEYDRKMLVEFQKVCIQVEEKQAELDEQQKELSALHETLTAQKNSLSQKLSSASGALSDAQRALAEAKAAEAQAAEDALNNAQNSQISGSTNSGSENNGSTTGGESGSTTPSAPSTPANVDDVVLLAAILQCEAGSYEGRLAVGTVIMNRLASGSYPNTLRGVIYQSGQFSPTWNGKLEQTLSKGPSQSAYTVAKDVLAGKRHEAVLNCYSFRSASTGKPGINIGGNVFF